MEFSPWTCIQHPQYHETRVFFLDDFPLLEVSTTHAEEVMFIAASPSSALYLVLATISENAA